MFRLNSNQFWLVENVFSIGQFGFAQFWFVYWVYHFWLHRNWLGDNLYHAMCHPIIIFNYYKIQNYNYKKIITYCSFWYKSRCTIKLNIASNLKNEIGKNNYKLLGYFQSTRSRIMYKWLKWIPDWKWIVKIYKKYFTRARRLKFGQNDIRYQS